MPGSFIALAVLLAVGPCGSLDPRVREWTLGALPSRYRDVSWRGEKAIAVELTGDGHCDLAVPGNRGDDFAVAVIIGPLAPQSVMKRMMWLRAGAEDSRECARSQGAVLREEPPTLPADLWGCIKQKGPDDFCDNVRKREAWLQKAAAGGMRGLRVSGDAGCTEIHMYWNPEARQFEQWQAE